MAMILKGNLAFWRDVEVGPGLEFAIGYEFFPLIAALLYIEGFDTIEVKSKMAVFLNNADFVPLAYRFGL